MYLELNPPSFLTRVYHSPLAAWSSLPFVFPLMELWRFCCLLNKTSVERRRNRFYFVILQQFAHSCSFPLCVFQHKRTQSESFSMSPCSLTSLHQPHAHKSARAVNARTMTDKERWHWRWNVLEQGPNMSYYEEFKADGQLLPTPEIWTVINRFHSGTINRKQTLSHLQAKRTEYLNTFQAANL